MSLFQDLLAALLKSFGSKQPKPEPTPTPTPEPTPIPPQPLPTTIIEGLLDAHNQERSMAGLPLLRLNDQLIQAAQKHTQWQANTNHMDHIGEGGSRPADRIAAEGYRWRSAAENVAMGYPNVSRVMRGWMSSPGHRNAILGNYAECGFGHAVAGNGTSYWTAVFAIPTPTRTFAPTQISAADMPDVMCSPLTCSGNR